MNRKTTLLVILLVSLILGYSIYDFYKTHEYKEVTIHSGLLNEARKNPFYASRLFLKRMGIPSVKKDKLQSLGGSDLPDTDTVIMITSSRSTLSTTRTEALLEWVKSGGHLIARSTTDWHYSGDNKEEDKLAKVLSKKQSRDPLQRLLGVRTGKRTYLKSDDDDGVSDAESTESENDDIINAIFASKEDAPAKYQIRLKGVKKPLKIQSYRFHPLQINKTRRSISEQVVLKKGNFIIRQRLGDGMVTLLSNMDFIKNYEIEKADHAEILWHLVHGLHTQLDQPKEIWLIHRDKMATLWSLLWKNASALIISLGLLLFFWLLKETRRFGPLIPKQQEDRRSLNEHITSSGDFYWKNNKKLLLLDSSRQALMQRLARVHPGWAQRSEDEQVHQLAEQLKLPSKTIHKLLYDNEIELNNDFTWLIQQLEKIRKSI